MPDIETCPFPAVAAVSPSALAVKIREIVARDPDFVYEVPGEEGSYVDATCLYAYKGGPSCLIGRGLHELGVPIEQLVALDTSPYGSATTYSEAYARAIGRRVTEVTRDRNVRWLDKIQYDQDSGVPYGTALDNADQYVAFLADGGHFTEEDNR